MTDYEDPEGLEDEDAEDIATPEEMKAEAVKRLHALDIFDDSIRQFENDGLVSISEPPLYAHYWADDVIKKVITEYQEDFGGLVYYGILTPSKEIGNMYSLFYVSKYKSEWPLDWDDLRSGQACVYVYNRSCPPLSDTGAIGYEHTRAGSLRRTW